MGTPIRQEVPGNREARRRHLQAVRERFGTAMNEIERMKIIDYASSPYSTKDAPVMWEVWSAMAQEILDLRFRVKQLEEKQ